MRQVVQLYARTVWLLIAHPGRLTAAHLAGQQIRFVLPMRLYLAASFLFFMLVKVLLLGHGGQGVGSVLQISNARSGSEQVQQKLKEANANGSIGIEIGNAIGQTETVRTGRQIRLKCESGAVCEAFKKVGAMDLTQLKELVAKTVSNFVARAPYLVFCLLPFYALLLKLVYWRRAMAYADHFVHSLHLHAFWFLTFLLLAVLPLRVGLAVVVWRTLYDFLSLQRVYGGRWLLTLLRGAAMTALYLITLLLGLLLLFVGEFIFAAM